MTKDLQKTWETAEAKAVALSNEYEQKRAALKDQYRDRIWDANKKAAEAQKAYLDAEAVAALKDRGDGQAVAESLGLTFD